MPTDPGSEVIYDAESYTMVSCHGVNAIIEDVSGAQLTVPLSDLKRGRVVSNRSWYYRAEGRAGAVRDPFYTDPESRANFQADGDGQVIFQPSSGRAETLGRRKISGAVPGGV